MRAQDGGHLEEAERYCMRLLDFGGPAKEGAKSLLREIRAVALAPGARAGGGAGGGVEEPMAMSPSG